MRRPSPGTAGPTIPVALGAVLVLYGVVSLIGITWGLPSRKIDKYLFGGGEVWSGEKIYRQAKAEAKFDPTRGADVDVDPINKRGDEPIPLTATEEDVAKIYLRYRLYTYQPDEMITMMALAGMRPSRLELDPRLYQYGGLFIYPVGALIKLCGLLGLIDVRNDVVFYLDHPDEFGKFYIVARAYSAAWGLIGVLVVYAIAKRLAMVRTPSASAGPDGKIEVRSSKFERASNARSGLLSAIFAIRHSIFATRPVAAASGSDSAPPTRGGATWAVRSAHRAGVLAALLFTLMPVVVCMSHEGKPHLPGAVLMLLAVYFAMRCAEPGNAKVEDRRSKIEKNTAGAEISIRQSTIDTCPEPRRNRQFFRWMCVCCGAALGMVLSSWPIFVLIPMVTFRAAGLSPRARLAHTIKGVAIGLAVYLVTNPYILINPFANREVLRSNFGNSLAMYQIARIGEGFVRVVELTIEGATLPMVVVGLVGLFIAVVRRNQAAVPLVVVAGVFLLQFVLIGAGKPAEYGRFGLFTNAALAIGAASLLAARGPRFPRLVRWLTASVIVFWVGYCGAQYARNFCIDTAPYNSRLKLAEIIFKSPIRETPSDPHQAPNVPIRRAVVVAEPAPYNCPPLPFAKLDVVLVADPKAARAWHRAHSPGALLVRTGDRSKTPFLRPSAHESYFELVVQLLLNPNSPYDPPETPISWANKPFFGHGLRVWDD